MPICMQSCSSRSRVIAAMAVLFMLPFLTNEAYAVTCNPTSTTKPQPTLPRGFTEQILYSGCLTQPTAMSFQNVDKTKVFIAEKGGKVWNCDLSSPNCTLFADLGIGGSNEVCNNGNSDDRGLLGLAVDPLNDTNVYVLYTTPPGCSGDGPTHGQLSLLTPDPSNLNNGWIETKILPAGSTTPTWCFYSTSHSIGGLAFGSDNKTLYVSAGDGASFGQVDYGQLDNECGDNLQNPPVNPPQGAFRSQGVSASWPYYDGVIIQITTPVTSGTTPTVTVVANGFRNPFRFAFNPYNTDDLYVGNVGWDTWEAIDHISTPSPNFGWPCYEGPDPQTGYQGTGLCGIVGNVTAPFFAYNHQSYVTAEDSRGKGCGGKPGKGPDQSGSVISAIGFTDGTSTTYPSPFKRALYFGDVRRQCIWAMAIPSNSNTPSNTPQTFAKGLQGGPVDLKAGPNGDLFYVDFITSTVRRITHQ